MTHAFPTHRTYNDWHAEAFPRRRTPPPRRITDCRNPDGCSSPLRCSTTKRCQAPAVFHGAEDAARAIVFATGIPCYNKGGCTNPKWCADVGACMGHDGSQR